MNERIEELILQAIDFSDATYKYDLSEGFKIQEWDKIRLEKFAELIVRECGKSCTLQGDEDDMFCKFGIKHFGVQE